MADEFDEGEKMRRIAKGLDDPSDTLKVIGALMVSASQRAFRNQAFGKKPWKPRNPINVYGIIADFAAGKTPPKRRFSSTRTLIDTGALRRSIAAKVEGRSVVVGSNLPYADVLHRGGEITSKTITKDVQKRLQKWLEGKGKAHKESLGWLLNSDRTDTQLKGEVKARPIVGITKEIADDIRDTVGVEIMEVE